MLLADGTRAIKVKLAAAVAANQLPIVGSYVETIAQTAEWQNAVPIHTVSNSTSEVTVVASPSTVGNVRKLNVLTVVNLDTAPATVIVYSDDATNERIAGQFVLSPGDCLCYTDGLGFAVLDAYGHLKQVQEMDLPLSGSTNGLPIKVTGTSSGAAVTVHTAIAGTTLADYLWLFATNTDTAARTITVAGDNFTDPDDCFCKAFSLAASGIPVPILTGQPLRNGLVVGAWAGTANVITLSGWVTRKRSAA